MSSIIFTLERLLAGSSWSCVCSLRVGCRVSGVDTSWVIDSQALLELNFATGGTRVLGQAAGQRTEATLASFARVDGSNGGRGNAEVQAPPPAEPPGPVRTIQLNFTFYAAFTNFNDVLDVYEGGEDLLGARIASFRGRETVNAAISRTF